MCTRRRRGTCPSRGSFPRAGKDDAMATMTLIQAINSALAGEMERNPAVVLLGEDIGKSGGVFRATEGLWERFGTERVRGRDQGGAVSLAEPGGLFYPHRGAYGGHAIRPRGRKGASDFRDAGAGPGDLSGAQGALPDRKGRGARRRIRRPPGGGADRAGGNGRLAHRLRGDGPGGGNGRGGGGQGGGKGREHRPAHPVASRRGGGRQRGWKNRAGA